MEIETLHSDQTILTQCTICSAPLRVVFEKRVVGDDYGSWVQYFAYLECGHRLEDMAKDAEDGYYNEV